jgi:hypothetical protein
MPSFAAACKLLNKAVRNGPRPPSFVVLGNPGGRRVGLFQAALANLGLPPVEVVSYANLLAGRDTLERVVRRGSIVRIESPGRDFEVQKAILAAGAGVADEAGPTRISREQALRLPFDKGRILYPRQWFLGFRETLRLVRQQLASCPEHAVMNSPADVEVMFDKRPCQELFARRGIPVPRPLGVVRSFAELRRRMKEADQRRVFVKLAHGSSACGTVAYETDGRHQQATTTVEMVRHNGELRLYNSRRIPHYQRPADIAALIDALAREGVQVEEWIRKPRLADQEFDFRVVVIAGKARHVVVRLSRTPMTNLHLLNQRADLALVLPHMGAAAWSDARQSCEAAAAAFPGCLYTGVDVTFAAGYRRHAVLEINAFGDLLNNVLCNGVDTYTAEVLTLLSPKRDARRQPADRHA